MVNKLTEFKKALMEEEKSPATVQKYIRDAGEFVRMVPGSIKKEDVIAYKTRLSQRFKPAGVNSRLVAVNRYLKFIGRGDCRVKLLRVQRKMFLNEEKELTVQEYKRLVRYAGKRRIGYVIQTICGTGIRVSELKFITVEAVDCGTASISCKGKERVILIPEQVRTLLKKYIKKAGVTSGAVFVTSRGNPIDRSNIWREMKELCTFAGVAPGKVFPHNLRHLFARTFYRQKKDIFMLADLLGHSSVDTTRIYTMESGIRHRNELNAVGKILFHNII